MAYHRVVCRRNLVPDSDLMSVEMPDSNSAGNLLSELQSIISSLAEVNGPQVRSSEWTALCLNTDKSYEPNTAALLVTFAETGTLTLTPVRHVHAPLSEDDFCAWRGWNLGMLTRGNLGLLMKTLPDHGSDSARKIFAGASVPRFQIAIVDGCESEIVSLSLATWEGIVTNVALHASSLTPNPCRHASRLVHDAMVR